MKEPKVIEMFADNGEHSHWKLIDENGEILWSEEPAEVKNNAVLPHVSGMCCAHEFLPMKAIVKKCHKCNQLSILIL